MNAGVLMPLPDEQFQAQARRAGRTVTWGFDAFMTGFLAVFLGAIGALLLLIEEPWLGSLVLLVAAALLAYGVWRICVGRHRDRCCPTCGVPGEIIKIEQSYQFHCPRCGQTAETGVTTDGGW